MTIEEFRASPRRRMPARVRFISIAALVVAAVLTIAAGMSSRRAAADDNSRTQDLQQQVQAEMQDLMVMRQNTAAWTTTGLVVLQGNRLLHYSADMKLQHTVTLPVPPALLPVDMTPNDYTSVATKPDGAPSYRSRLTARIIPSADGLILVRGLQLIWLTNDLRVVGQATLPELPLLTAAELAVICPMVPGDEMHMGGPSMPGMLSSVERPTANNVPQR